MNAVPAHKAAQQPPRHQYNFAAVSQNALTFCEFQARACSILSLRHIYRMGTTAIETLPGDVHVTRVKHLRYTKVRDACWPPPGLRLSCAPNSKDKTYHNSIMNRYC